MDARLACARTGSALRAALFITGGTNVRGVAVDDGHVYWANWGHVNPPGTVGRANLDGTSVDQNFITGAIDPYALTVDGAHVYWNDANLGAIGRANLDATGVTPSFIGGANDYPGVAVDGAHIYWANAGAIARANLNGTGVEPSFITGGDPAGVAVDGAHIYWANRADQTIGRANLNGTGVDQAFLAVDRPAGIAVDGGHIYWTGTSGSSDNAIGRANLDGTGVEQNFIIGGGQTVGVAVDDKRYPTADAGPDQTAKTGASVTLSGARSSDANGDPLSYSWTQTTGPAVALSGVDTATPRFTAPADPAGLAFRLDVCDPVPLCATAATKVTTKVTVAPDPPPKITKLKVSPRSFAAGARQTALAAKAGAKIKVTLSEDARVRFRVQRDPRHRGSGSRPKHPHVFKRRLSEGGNSVEFTGTLGGRTFEPGAYQLIARARDAAGQASERVRTSFEIVP